MKKTKNQNGVTLVSLVVTIIVLIILAGISINLLLGNNGIITIANFKSMALGDYRKGTYTNVSTTITIPNGCEEAYLYIPSYTGYNSSGEYINSISIEGDGKISSELIISHQLPDMSDSIYKCEFIPGKTITITLDFKSDFNGYYVYAVPVHLFW